MDEQPIRVGMVSVYPWKAGQDTQSGVASYARDLALSLGQRGAKVTVFADRSPHPEEPPGDFVRTVRCWDRGGPRFAVQVLKKALGKEGEFDIFHLQHEYFLYGGLISTLTFPLMLVGLRFRRKPVLVTLHGVIPIGRVNEEFAVQNNLRGKPLPMRIGILLVTKLIIRLSAGIIVHSDCFRSALTKDYRTSESKIHTIPHGVNTAHGEDPRLAKRSLGVEGMRVILFFGYLSGYKGLARLISEFAALKDDRYALLICGGLSPRIKDTREGTSFYSSIDKLVRESKGRVVLTGFVPAASIATYFSAADLIVFPYTIAMSSSGPMNLAVAYRRPFIASQAFAKMIDGCHIFGDAEGDLTHKITEVLGEQRRMDKIIQSVDRMRAENAWETVSRTTLLLYRRIIEECRQGAQ
jgi:glycosyltransferase involved in cell wall biosynthesis